MGNLYCERVFIVGAYIYLHSKEIQRRLNTLKQ
jgi:hypothetical protein